MLTPPVHAHFLCDYDTVLDRIDAVDPARYSGTRNYLDGAVTWLGPFITHGVIDTRQVAERILERHSPSVCYRLLSELAWREYFHRVWQQRQDAIFADIKQPQSPVADNYPPASVLSGTTGIEVLDETIAHLVEHGTMHNHARMWVAGIICNMARTAWFEPARWLHYHLLDGDLASNTLSWQWIAGTFSHKKYIANQANINKYSRHKQTGTWLDRSYDELAGMPLIPEFDNRAVLCLVDDEQISCIDREYTGTVALRSIWQLDPQWAVGMDHQLVFVDMDFRRQWPFSPARWQFIRHWVNQIPGAELICGSVDQLDNAVRAAHVTRVEYPATPGWPGRVEPRSWLYPEPQKTLGSFSRFWKEVKTGVLNQQ